MEVVYISTKTACKAEKNLDTRFDVLVITKRNTTYLYQLVTSRLKNNDQKKLNNMIAKLQFFWSFVLVVEK